MLLEIVPDFPDAKTFTPHPDVVEEEQATRSKFRQPGVDVMAHGFFRMQSVEMKNVDTFVFEAGQGFIEVASHQGRERFIVSAVVLTDLGKRGLVVFPGMFIAAPGVHAEAMRPGLMLGRCLAKGEVAFTAIDSELDEQAGPESCDQIVGKVEMWRPRSDAVEARLEMTRRQIWLGHSGQN